MQQAAVVHGRLPLEPGVHLPHRPFAENEQPAPRGFCPTRPLPTLADVAPAIATLVIRGQGQIYLNIWFRVSGFRV